MEMCFLNTDVCVCVCVCAGAHVWASQLKHYILRQLFILCMNISYWYWEVCIKFSPKSLQSCPWGLFWKKVVYLWGCFFKKKKWTTIHSDHFWDLLCFFFFSVSRELFPSCCFPLCGPLSSFSLSFVWQAESVVVMEANSGKSNQTWPCRVNRKPGHDRLRAFIQTSSNSTAIFL